MADRVRNHAFLKVEQADVALEKIIMYGQGCPCCPARREVDINDSDQLSASSRDATHHLWLLLTGLLRPGRLGQPGWSECALSLQWTS